MGRRINYGDAKESLENSFNLVEERFRQNDPFVVPEALENAFGVLFNSTTQAFREALLGCLIAKIMDPEIDIRLPYIKQGDNAFSGRTLDERVINPFLQEKEIPCSKAPYLSSLRRNISFVPDTEKGLRDKEAYGAMLLVINETLNADENTAKNLLYRLLYEFLKLRDQSKIKLSRINRLSIEQYSQLVDALLTTQSGGQIPLLLAIATFKAIKEAYELPWEISWQGINVADSASGVGGDITIERDGNKIISVEVTERPIDADRVRSTFRTKITTHGIEDYLFIHSIAQPTEDARSIARTYFAQGHEINFVSIKEWILVVLSTLGSKGRIAFTNCFVDLLSQRDVPAALKVSWNNIVRDVIN